MKKRSPFYLVWLLMTDIIDPTLLTMRASLCKGKHASYAECVTDFDINVDENDPNYRKHIVSVAEHAIIGETTLITKEIPALVQLHNETWRDMTGVPIRRI